MSKDVLKVVSGDKAVKVDVFFDDADLAKLLLGLFIALVLVGLVVKSVNV